MVCIDAGNARRGGWKPKFFPFNLTVFTALAALFLTLTVMAAEGFGENGLRLGSEVAWRFSFFVFFAALVAEPLGKLVPLGFFRLLGQQGRQLHFSFGAAIAVYLASVLVPNAPLGLNGAGLDVGMMLFVLLCGGLVATMIFAETAAAVRLLGAKACRAIAATGAVYFWLVYSAIGLGHISGPHRPDIFYGLSLSLMIAALLICFADRLVRKWTEAAASVG